MNVAQQVESITRIFLGSPSRLLGCSWRKERTFFESLNRPLGSSQVKAQVHFPYKYDVAGTFSTPTITGQGLSSTLKSRGDDFYAHDYHGANTFFSLQKSWGTEFFCIKKSRGTEFFGLKKSRGAEFFCFKKSRGGYFF